MTSNFRLAPFTSNKKETTIITSLSRALRRRVVNIPINTKERPIIFYIEAFSSPSTYRANN